MKHLALRNRVISTGNALDAAGINHGSSGNISVRTGETLLITPSGMPYDQLRPSDLVEMRADGAVAAGNRKPSSEWRFHVHILGMRRDVDCVIHTHPPFCTVLACHGMEIPAFHYMVAVAGGDSIRCAPYALFGTQALSDGVVDALTDRRACLLANHGMIALGPDLPQTLALATEVENLAAQYWRALQIGTPNILSDEQMREVLARFSTYGQQ